MRWQQFAQQDLLCYQFCGSSQRADASVQLLFVRGWCNEATSPPPKPRARPPHTTDNLSVLRRKTGECSSKNLWMKLERDCLWTCSWRPVENVGQEVCTWDLQELRKASVKIVFPKLTQDLVGFRVDSGTFKWFGRIFGLVRNSRNDALCFW